MSDDPMFAHVDDAGALVALVFDDAGLPEGHSIVPLPDDYHDRPWRWDVAGAGFVPDIEAARETKKVEIEARMAACFLAGYPASIGALAGYRLQVRDERDRSAWLTSQAAYSAQVAAGNGGAVGAKFRTADNVNVTLTFAQGQQELLKMAAWGAAIFSASWDLKDEVLAAATFEDIDAIDIEAAPWPGEAGAPQGSTSG